jgi:hypothetical protein
MFKILGADGKEYGPTTAEQIKEWIRQGRANHETMAQAAGETGWKPLAQYADFADVFPPAQAPAPSAPDAAAPVPAAAAPSAAPAGPSPDLRAKAQQMVAGPAIGLLIMAALGILLQIVGIVMNLLGVTFPMQQQDLTPEAARMMHLFTGVIGVVSGVIGIAVSIFIIFCALKMQKLASHGLAMAGAIVAMVPCFSPCCLLGLPIGIWALVVLSKPEVRSQFDR